jgi:hypothetical protein
LNTKIDARGKTASLELQEKCSKQAREEYAENGWKKEPMASYTNHYKEKMNKCFVLIGSTTPFNCKGTLLSGEEKLCHSSDEFDEIVKLYMHGEHIALQ